MKRKLNSGKMTNSTTTRAPAIANWNEQKSKLKAKFSTLTYADLQYEENKKDEMLNHIRVKLGKTREEMAAIISAL
ncbi:MAG: general stress protein CsbD [Bacteroidia bacterium]